MTDVLPVTVVMPTLGRAPLLRECLASIAACSPAPAEVLLVDQSRTGAAVEAAAGLGLPLRVIVRDERGISGALNVALAEATNDMVLITHDDCRVRSDWVGAAYRAHLRQPDVLLTGRVIPEGGRPMPAINPRSLPREYHDTAVCNVMLANNLAASAAGLRSSGGFDERFTTAAEDSDFCYRWLMAGRVIRFEPSMVIWHRDWRTFRDLRRLYKSYWRAHGEMHAKHLRVGDRRLLPTMRAEVEWVIRGTIRRILLTVLLRRRNVVPPDMTGGFSRMPLGLVRGLLRPPAPPPLRARR